jgi:hypothetical protein
MLAAEDSTSMAQENNDCGLPQPKRAEADFAPAAIGQVHHRQPAA